MIPSLFATSSIVARKATLAATSLLALAAFASAQVGTNFTFSQNTGTYSPIGGTQIAGATGLTGPAGLDDVTYTLTLPFSFTFDGQSYTTVQAQTNGFLAFGTTVPANSYTPLSSTIAVPGFVSGFGRDLMAGWMTSADRDSTTNVLTNVVAMGPMQVGDFIGGTGIAAGATITAITGNTITMSANATSTGTAGYIYAAGPWAEMRSETLGSAPNQIFVVQWSNFRPYTISTLTTAAHFAVNFQIRLHEATGEVEVVYGNCSPGAVTSTTVAQVGLRGPSNAFPANVNNRVNTKGVNDDWSLSAPGTANSSGMLFNNVAPANVIASGLTYTWSPPAGVASSHASYGAGCYTRSATWYESFSSFDLSNTAVRQIPNGQGGYTMIPGAPTAFVHTVPGLALGDDSIGTLALPTAFNYPGGSSTALSICSNGYIWLQANTLADWSPTVGELFSNGARFAPLWVDMVGDGATNINNVFAEVDASGTKAYVTWADVPTYTTPGSVNMQVEFDLTTGEVNYTYNTVSVPATAAIAGWSPGVGLSTVDTGNIDISASLPFSTAANESISLALSAAPAPVLGASVTYTTDNIPATALLSAQLVSLGQINPGLDLGTLGAPGCLQLVDLSLAATTIMLGGPSTTFVINLPSNPAFAGLPLNLQSASLDPTANAAGLITSNAVRSIVGTF